ncbi:hypothetical protein MBLNU457_1765t1 [Dothideomycetes sp. NU457]
MQQQSGSRKRAAPGTSPMPQQPPSPQPGYQFDQGSPMVPDPSFSQFNAENFANTTFDPNIYPSFGLGQPANLPTVKSSPSNQLVRRNTNQQLMVGNQAQDQWLAPPTTGAAWEVNDSDQELDRKAAMAKRDAQAKRKQIPPFVLKLWSFLNDNKNTELIRWTDNGTAFTVLDEDEFARTLIPELFKHNNYASFVRQLNMYGFHKKVGLNANSMKAAEKKTKDPNVYSHEYFREGREDLLWLIQKPQGSKAAAKRKRGQDSTKDHGDSDGSRESPEVEGQVGIRNNTADIENLSKQEVASVRSEIQKLQRQQSVISKIITQLKEQNEQFYRQASEFQSMHERHENSINAILTFLATFYNRSVGGSANLNNMFGNMQQPQQPQGTVVDMGDGDFAENPTTNNTNVSSNNNQQLQRFRRPQLLLEGSPVRESTMQPGNISSLPPSNRASATRSPPSRESRNNRIPSLGAQGGASTPSARASASPTIKDDIDTPPNMPSAYPETDDMMSYINAANANSPANASGSPSFDFSRALNHAQTANGHSPLTAQQRNDMLSLIASQAGSSGASDNALTNPNPPPMPNLDQYARTQEQLEMLTRLQREQDSKVQDLAGRLQPLSPSGSILEAAYGPAGQMSHNAAEATGGSDFDIDAFINSGEYFGNYDGAETGTAQDQGAQVFGDDDPTGLDFDFGNVGGDDPFNGEVGNVANQDQGRVESVHSSPGDGVVAENADAGDEETPSKRLRRS